MLICVGEILVDVFDEDGKQSLFPGGAPFNVASNALLYTKDVSFYGAVGKDEEGNFLLDFASKRPFKTLSIKTLPDYSTTKAIVSLKEGERSFHFERDSGADYHLSIQDIHWQEIQDEDIVHIGSLMLSYPEGVSFFHSFVHEIRSRSKAKISFDINYRDDIFPSEEVAKDVFIKALSEADILKFSVEELRLLSGEEEISLGLKRLLKEEQMAVVTLGKEGSLFYSKGKIVKVPSFPVKPVDTTGAGDAFYAYFLASLVNHPSFIEEEDSLIKYLTYANVAGALTTLRKGAINAAPSQEEIESFLQKTSK